MDAHFNFQVIAHPFLSNCKWQKANVRTTEEVIWKWDSFTIISGSLWSNSLARCREKAKDGQR